MKIGILFSRGVFGTSKRTIKTGNQHFCTRDAERIGNGQLKKLASSG